MEPGLEAVSYYDPPNMTYPFGAYICVMDIDVDTGVYKVRRFYALDDCGTRINPMIIEGQVHGGLTEAFAIAMGQEIRYDDDRQRGHRLVHGFLHADRGRDAALGNRLHRRRPRRIIRSAPRASAKARMSAACRAFSNAVNDAFSFLGSTHIQMPHDYWRNWKAAKDLGAVA